MTRRHSSLRTKPRFFQHGTNVADCADFVYCANCHAGDGIDSHGRPTIYVKAHCYFHGRKIYNGQPGYCFPLSAGTCIKCGHTEGDLEVTEIDAFAGLDDLQTEPEETPATSDETLMNDFAESLDWLMCPPADATIEEITTVEERVTELRKELIARGIVDKDGGYRTLDRMRDTNADDYKRLISTLLTNGICERLGDATFMVNSMLEKLGFNCGDPDAVMTWPQYNEVQRSIMHMVAEHQGKQQQAKEKKTRTRKSSGSAKNAKKDSEPDTSPSPANAKESTQAETNSTASDGEVSDTETPDSSNEAEEHNRYAFVGQLDQWVEYEDGMMLEQQEIPAEHLPTPDHFVALAEYCCSKYNMTQSAYEEIMAAEDDALSWNNLKRRHDFASKVSQVQPEQRPDRPEANDIPAALRMIGLAEPPNPNLDAGTDRGLDIVNAVLEKRFEWQSKITVLQQQHDRKLKPLTEKIEWFDTVFGAFIDADARKRIQAKNRKKDGSMSATYHNGKYWDYDYGRVSFEVTGGPEVVHGDFEKFIQRIGELRDKSTLTDEENREYTAHLETLGPLIESIKIKYEHDKKVLKALFEQKIPVPGTKVTTIDPLGSKRKIEGLKK